MTALLQNQGDGRFTRDQERKHLHHGHDSPEACPLGCAWEDPHLEIMAGLSESGWKRKGPAGHRDIQVRGGVGIGSECHTEGSSGGKQCGVQPCS